MVSQALSRLVSILSLERLEQNLFRGQSQNMGIGHVFGGQVMGQALSAARQTVAPDRYIHSFHSYFLRPGIVDLPIIYDVEVMRDGGSFSARRVKAIQQGQPIFYMTCSFQAEETGFEHQDPMPAVEGPEGILNQQQLAAKYAESLPNNLPMFFAEIAPIEIRLVNQINPLDPQPMPAKRYAWMRVAEPMMAEQNIHDYLLAYASDFEFLFAAAQPHGVSFLTQGMRFATIDHAMWFHRPIKFDEWLLYAVDSPSATGGRGLVRGQFFNQAGELVASTIQEGLMRQTKR